MGFLTVVEDPQHGLFGGYLLLNLAGRPVEFHCTAPIKPNRAQEILYGPTLEPYLFGEQIGRTLMGKGGVEPLVVCTDREPVLAVRELVATPVALVLPPEGLPESGNSAPPSATAAGQPGERAWRVDAAHRGPRGLSTFRVGRNHLAVRAACGDDQPLIVDRLACLDESFELDEPFSRIREAIDEARRGGQ